MTVPIDEVRKILGASAEGRTDADLERLRDGLVAIAHETYDALTKTASVSREDIEAAAVDLPGFPAVSERQLRDDAADRVSWLAYGQEHGDDAQDSEV